MEFFIYFLFFIPFRFSNKHHLQSHEDRHSGNRRHACTYCDKKFYVKYDCDRHLKIHHLKHGKLRTREVPTFSHSTKQVTNMVIEKGQPQMLSRDTNVVIESNHFCK